MYVRTKRCYSHPVQDCKQLKLSCHTFSDQIHFRFMRPNTPHCVVTTNAAICHGGHFYASSTVRDSCHGFLSSFVGSSLLTNTEHTSDALLMLRRLVEYFHLVYLGGGDSIAGK
jgi:hypothetical protein